MKITYVFLLVLQILLAAALCVLCWTGWCEKEVSKKEITSSSATNLYAFLLAFGSSAIVQRGICTDRFITENVNTSAIQNKYQD